MTGAAAFLGLLWGIFVWALGAGLLGEGLGCGASFALGVRLGVGDFGARAAAGFLGVGVRLGFLGVGGGLGELGEQGDALT